MISQPAQKLLDKVPGAVNPFTLRKAQKYYFSNVVRVRNGTTNAEADIGLVNDDLSQAALTALLAGATPYMRTWSTQSGATTLGQSQNGQQPQIAADINGKYALRFDGSDDSLNMNISLAQPSLYFTICMVMYVAAGATGTLLQISTNVGSIDKRVVLAMVSGVLQIRFYDSANGGYYTNIQMTAAISGSFTLAVVNNNKTITVQVNGVTVATTSGTSPFSASPTGMFIGADRGFQNYLAFSLGDFFPYERALTTSELDNFTADAKAYYGIA